MPTTATQFANNIIEMLELTEQEKFELKALEVQHQVCELMGWPEDYYASWIHGTAINFLTYHTNADEVLVRKFEESKVFWGWFKTLWVNETAILIPAIKQQTKTLHYYCFAAFWDARELAQQVIIPKCVWNDILTKMKK